MTFVMVNYAPAWEAASKTIVALRHELEDDLDTRLVGFNTRGTLLQLLGGRTRQLPAALLLAPGGLVRAAIGDSAVLHVFASGGERFLLPKVAGPGAILSIAKGGSRLDRLERNVRHLNRFRFVIVESRRERDLLAQCGVERERVRLIYPAAPLSPHVAPPSDVPFTIAFATSPLSPGNLLTRGVHLMIRVAALLPDVRFIFAWRKCDHEELQRLIAGAGVRNIDVRNGVVDMHDVFASAHATILPGLCHDSLKPCPQSLVDSLAHGKPVLVSTPTHVADLIATSGAGVVFEPGVDALCDAIRSLRERYAECQARCQPTAASTFSPETFVAKHRALYTEILEGRA